jgi:hypothetical protein
MSRTLTSSAVDRGFDPWSGQFKDYKIGICCFSAKHCSIKEEKEPGNLALNNNHPLTQLKHGYHYFICSYEKKV